MAIVTTLAIGTGVLASAGASTFLAPRNVHIERKTKADVVPADVVRFASSNALYQEFNPFKDSDPNLQVELFGPEAGVGSGFHFKSKDGNGTCTITDVTATSVTYQLDLGPMGKPVQKISVRGDTLVWEMDLDMGNNPIGRIMGLFMNRIVGPSFEKGLANLAQVAA